MSKTIVITGANSGIGLALTKLFVAQGNHVVALCRDNQNNRNLIDKLNKNGKAFGLGKVDFIGLNLNNLHSVRQAAHQVINLFEKVDVVICNAGVMNVPYLLTQQKFEQHFQVNYLSQFLLVHLMLPSLMNSDNPRVIFNCSKSVENAEINDIERLKAIALIKESAYNGTQSYRESKLIQMLMSKFMAGVFPEVSFASVYTGPVNTNLITRVYGEWFRILSLPFIGLAITLKLVKTPKKAAETFAYFVNEKTIESGKFWEGTKQKHFNTLDNEAGYLKDAYEQSKKWVGLL
jgi:NAD(P)-dependent dehydrogenase (short-subunit alcohol dehydrogenase family)